MDFKKIYIYMVVLLIVDKYMTVTHPKSYVQITNNVTTQIIFFNKKINK